MTKEAFLMALNIKASKTSKLTRLGSPDKTVTVPMAISNYGRSLAGPANVTITGKEFVMAKDTLEKTDFGDIPKKGDRIYYDGLGTLMIGFVDPMSDVGGDIIGWRLRTE